MKGEGEREVNLKKIGKGDRRSTGYGRVRV